MKRRDFVKKTVPAAAIMPAVINGYSIRSFAGSSLFQSLVNADVETDHVLVIVQLNGGNDGLNTVIPISTYNRYYSARTNIAIPESKILKLSGYANAGLHPSLKGMQDLYNQGKLSIVQAVGYPSPNFSHFRATDIWMSGSDSNTVLNSGWGGRFLDNEFPNYPTNYPNSKMPDPLAIQIGSVTSLTCQGPVVNMGMSITDPNSFYNFINGVEDPAPYNNMGYELSYIRDVAKQTNLYAQRVKAAAVAVTSQSAYPANSLADQLKIVARLIKGGLKTKIYMVSTGGYDTHSLQAVATDTTTGTHANLLNNLSTSIKAFVDDLEYLGIQDRVIGMTFSEFGRRIKSNASGGTDHGAAAPMFLFGKNVVSGVVGSNPEIPAGATVNDNIPFQYDFRSIYASVLQRWFCVNETELQMILMKKYQSLNIVNSKVCGTSLPDQNEPLIISNYPNPFTESTTIQFYTKGGHTLVQIINSLGQVLTTLVDREYATAGNNSIYFNGYGLPAGVYYARLQNGPVQQVRSMLKVR